MIKYSIALNPEAHLYSVTLNFEAKHQQEKLYLPVWIPGSYMVREFSKNITDISLKDTDGILTQTSKNEWLIDGLKIGTQLTLIYNVYAYEYGIRTAFLDFTRGYFNPTSLCLAVEGQEDTQHKVDIINLPNKWNIACGLNKNGQNYTAIDYDELLDCPFELGLLQTHKFIVNNTPHYLVLSGTILPFDKERILTDIAKICEYQINMFGGVAPYEHYTFILNLCGEVYTGLEHRNSTLLMSPYYALPNLNKTNEDDYIKLMGLISHEFFHTWNVKRIKPKVFTPYDVKQENYTKLLWWFEGVTSYYDDLVMYLSGVINQDKYLGFIVENLNNVYKFDGVNKQSIANSSLTSWVKYYRQDENSPNSIVSYYVKGSLVAMCLDLLIRKESKFSLDDVLRYMFNEWQKNPVGIAEDGIPQIIKEATGVDLTEFIKLATETTAKIDFKSLLSDFGLSLDSRHANDHQVSGKYHSTAQSNHSRKQVKLDLGAKLEKQSLGYLVKNVYNSTTAQTIGLAVNDLIVAIDNVKLTNLDKQLSFYQIGDKVQLTVFRQEKLLTIDATLAISDVNIFDIYLQDKTKLSKWL